MTLSLVVNATTNDAPMQISRYIKFARDNHLDSCSTNVILFFDKEQQDLIKEFENIFPRCHLEMVRMPLYIRNDVVEFLQSELNDSEIILFPGNAFGTEIATRLAYRLGAVSMNNIHSLELSKGTALVTKNIYSGNICAEYLLRGNRFVFTVDKTLKADKYIPSDMTDHSFDITYKELEERPSPEGFTKEFMPSSDDIKESDIVVVLGRGIGNKENADRLVRMANDLSIPVLASRPVAMNGWIEPDRIAGVSGYMLSPKLAIVLGASGAPALYSGICDSGYIICVNNDIGSPIIKKSDLSIVGDCINIFSLFYELVQKERKHL